MDLLIESPPPIGQPVTREWRSTADFWRHNGATLAGPLHGAIEERAPAPILRGTDLRVRLLAIGSGQIEAVGARSLESMNDRTEGSRAGFAGVVEDVGPEVQGLVVGDEVFGIAGADLLPGGEDPLVVDSRVVARRPRRLSCDDSAAIVLPAVAAWQMLFKVGQLERGETVLIVGADTPIGRLAVQLAALHDVRTVAVARPSDIDLPDCASRIIDLSPGALEAQSRLAAVIVDTVGGAPYQRAVKAMRHGATLVSCVDHPKQAFRTGVRFYAPDVVCSACLGRIAELIDAGLIEALPAR
jgi:NADPH2:quinone reductase